ncbi:hypothetical protein ABBQ32_010970 [Trebouxia sp. C0010 RCD-2024]
MVYSYHFGVQTIAPALGCILTISRSLVPLRDVLNVRKDRRLGELNPTPFAAMILNHTGWIVYAVLHTDWFIFTMDSSGLIIGIWMMFSLYPLAHTQVWRSQRVDCLSQEVSTFVAVEQAALDLQVQNRLNGLVVVAAILYCTLALVSMILNAVNSPAIPLLCTALHLVQSYSGQELRILPSWNGHSGIPQLGHVDNIWRGMPACQIFNTRHMLCGELHAQLTY